MKSKVKPYVAEVRRATCKKALTRITEGLNIEVADLRGQGYIDATEQVVERWRQRVEQFHEDQDAIALNLLRYEKLPDLLDAANRSMICQTLNGVRNRVCAVRSPSGLKRVVAEFLDGDPEYRDEGAWNGLKGELLALANSARGTFAPPRRSRLRPMQNS